MTKNELQELHELLEDVREFVGDQYLRSGVGDSLQRIDQQLLKIEKMIEDCTHPQCTRCWGKGSVAQGLNHWADCTRCYGTGKAPEYVDTAPRIIDEGPSLVTRVIGEEE